MEMRRPTASKIPILMHNLLHLPLILQFIYEKESNIQKRTNNTDDFTHKDQLCQK